MPKFSGPLRVNHIPESPFWEIAYPLSYTSDLLADKITVPKGFITDFASVPRLPFVYLMFGGTSHRASVIHDALYRKDIDVPEVDQKTADAIFLEAMETNDDGWISRWGKWLGVRVGGCTSWKKKSGLRGPLEKWRAIK